MFDITVSPNEQDGNLAYPRSRIFSVSTGDLDSATVDPYIDSSNQDPVDTVVVQDTDYYTVLTEINNSLQTGLLFISIFCGLLLGCIVMLGFWLGGNRN